MAMHSRAPKVGRGASLEIRNQAADLCARYRELREVGALRKDGVELADADSKSTGKRLICNPNMLLFALDDLAKYETFSPPIRFKERNKLIAKIGSQIRSKNSRGQVEFVMKNLAISKRHAQRMQSPVSVK
jgi:hypothetical protein